MYLVETCFLCLDTYVLAFFRTTERLKRPERLSGQSFSAMERDQLGASASAR